MAYDAYIFDLDGTLLNTLPDLARLTNMVLEERNWPQRTVEEVLSFVGHGGRYLLSRAIPAGTPDELLDEVFARWRELYPAYGHAMTKPYEGIPEVLDALKERGAKLAVLSNKFDAAVGQVIAEHFPGVFDIARGECEEIPRKPDPAGLRMVMRQLGVAPERVAYVGDSVTDVRTALNAGLDCVGVLWGFRDRQLLLDTGAKYIAAVPDDVLRVAEKHG